MKILSFRNFIKYTLFLFMLSIFLFSCIASESDSQNAPSVYTSPERIEQGEQLYLSLGCAQCHTKDGKRLLAPTFKGVYGKEEQLSDGRTVMVNEEYIRESILQPEAKIVAGFQPMHPPQSWDLNDEKIDALIAFIISLK